MALTERSRSALYRGLSEVINDEEAVGEMLSYFPARDVEEPATKEFVRAEIAGLRSEMAGLRAEILASRNQMIIWTSGANATLLALVLAITRLT